MCLILYRSLSNPHQNAENRLEIGSQIAEIFQNQEQNIKHVELSIAAHRMRFLGIAAPLEHTIAGAQHRSVWPGLMRVPEFPSIGTSGYARKKRKCWSLFALTPMGEKRFSSPPVRSGFHSKNL